MRRLRGPREGVLVAAVAAGAVGGLFDVQGQGIYHHSGGDAMLVLGRHKDETIVINDDIRITVVDIRGDKVRIGIDAPPEVAVHREEVWRAIQAERNGAGPAAR